MGDVLVGVVDGVLLGVPVGDELGAAVGKLLGLLDGDADGVADGARVNRLSLEISLLYSGASTVMMVSPSFGKPTTVALALSLIHI